MRLGADIRLDGHRIEVRTDLRKAPTSAHAPILTALGAHLDLEVDVQHLHKASSFDPRYPELMLLLRRARRDWATAGDELVAAIEKALAEGHLLPLNDKNERFLAELFRDHHLRLELRFAGRSADTERMERFRSQGLIDPDRAVVPISFRLGRGLNALRMTEDHPKSRESLEQVVRRALQVELTPADRHALEFASRQAGIYLRAPGTAQRNAVERLLTMQELERVRGAVSGVLEEGAGSQTLEQRLRDEVRSPRLQNDMERIARTEIAFAQSFGAWRAMKEQLPPEGSPGADPEVFKLTNPGACVDCRRLWGPPGSPIRYRLSVVEQATFAGYNFTAASRDDWRPTIGPTHPRCTCSRLMVHTPGRAEAIADTAAEIMAAWTAETEQLNTETPE